MKNSIKNSNLYTFVIKTINGENIEEFNLGVSSKNILKKIKYFLDLDINNTFEKKLLEEHKINLSIARRMILEEQSKQQRKRIKNG